MRSSFLQKRKEQFSRTPNPCRHELKFNGAKGTFSLYNRDEPDKDNRTTPVKEKSIKLVIIDVVKQLHGFKPATKKLPKVSVGSNFFKDYSTDKINVWVNSQLEDSGTYNDIKGLKEEHGARVNFIAFCFCPTLKMPLTFVVGGGKKDSFKLFWKKAGGFSSEPYVEISKGEQTEGDSFNWWNLDIKTFDESELSDADIEEIELVGPQIVDYINEDIAAHNQQGAKSEKPEGLDDEDEYDEDTEDGPEEEEESFDPDDLEQDY